MPISGSPPITAAQIYAECQSPGLPFDMAGAAARQLCGVASGPINIADFLGKSWEMDLFPSYSAPSGGFDGSDPNNASSANGVSFISGEFGQGGVGLLLDFGQSRTIVSMVITTLTANGSLTTTFGIDSSPDGSSWTNRYQINPTPSYSATLTPGVAARYWRISKVNVDFSRVTVDGWASFRGY